MSDKGKWEFGGITLELARHQLRCLEEGVKVIKKDIRKLEREQQKIADDPEKSRRFYFVTEKLAKKREHLVTWQNSLEKYREKMGK